MPDLILALDQGTTGSTAMVFDKELRVHGRATVEFAQHFPRPGWVEHEPGEIWDSVLQSIAEALVDISPACIAAIGITNQRETAFVWDAESGQSIGPAIVWQDRRTSGVCTTMKPHENRVRALTGLPIDPYFSATKLAWIKAQYPGRRLAFGTSDSFLIHRLAGEHMTDPSNASRTLLFDIHRGEWSRELIELFDVQGITLPRVVPSSGVCARVRHVPPLPDGIPIAGIAGDQQAALFGQGCFEPGQTKITYGTGSFVLMNTGRNPVQSQRGLLSTVAWDLGDGLIYALEGGCYTAGALVQWLRDGLGIIASVVEVEALAASVSDCAGITIIPALSGLGGPHWRPEAKGLIAGITRGTTKAHIARAALESIAHSQCDILDVMADESGGPLKDLRVGGGASTNNLLMQMQADLSGVTLLRPELVETTALGAAMFAGLGVGLWASLDDLRKVYPLDRAFRPSFPRDQIESMRFAWSKVLPKA